LNRPVIAELVQGFMRRALVCLAMLTIPLLLRAQSATPAISEPVISYEVVSIKPNHSGSGAANSSLFPVFSPHVSATNVTTKWLLEMGYGIKDFQLSGAPPWINADRYDIAADIEESQFGQIRKLSRDDQLQQVQLLIQSLLADRFKLKITRETKQLPIMALAAEKNASKLAQFADQPYPNPINSPGVIVMEFGRDSQRTVKATKTTMDNFASALSRVLEQQVVNETAVSGNYTFTISWTDPMEAGPSAATDTGPSVQAALEDELGLKLESTKGPVETITIDRIEKPSPN
jgi:uncharacterized protein (TIGR03435 family)